MVSVNSAQPLPAAALERLAQRPPGAPAAERPSLMRRLAAAFRDETAVAPSEVPAPEPQLMPQPVTQPMTQQFAPTHAQTPQQMPPQLAAQYMRPVPQQRRAGAKGWGAA